MDTREKGNRTLNLGGDKTRLKRRESVRDYTVSGRKGRGGGFEQLELRGRHDLKLMTQESEGTSRLLIDQNNTT